MKKIILCLLLLFVASCQKDNKAIVCSTISYDEKTNVDVVYTYDRDGMVVGIDKVVTITYDKEDLNLKSLKDRYNDIKEEVIDKAIVYTITMDEKTNTIQSITSIDLTKYDFDEDLFLLGEKKDYNSITKLIEEVLELGYFNCK